MGAGDALGSAGRHPDPDAASTPRPNPTTWPAGWRDTFASPLMDRFRQVLALDNLTVREAVLDDLVTHFHLSPAEALERCLDWEHDSVAEWQAKPRDGEDAITDFYRTTRSWCFDLLWYAYLQAEGFAYPSSVDIVRSLDRMPAAGPVLDFGSGVGVTGQLLHGLGRRVTLADISATLLDFARFRLARRGVTLPLIDLTEERLPEHAYGVITAIDTLTHVPDLSKALRTLHTALQPGGVLFTNLDVRASSPGTAWHLYEDENPLRLQLYRAGFRPAQRLEWGMVRYRRVEPDSVGSRAWRLAKSVELGTPVGRVLHGVGRRVRR